MCMFKKKSMFLFWLLLKVVDIKFLFFFIDFEVFCGWFFLYMYYCFKLKDMYKCMENG